MDAAIGRDQELQWLREFVERRAGAGALLRAGEAGIGKTTLWLAGVQAARERSLRVLAAHPAAGKRDRARAGLGDLPDGVLEELLPEVPAPRRRALEVALLLADAGDDRRTRARTAPRS